MRLLMAGFAATILAGCTTPGDLLRGEPTVAAVSSKDAKAYALCVLPKWQEHHAGVTMNDTVDGYRLVSAVESVGQTNELLEIRRVEAGSEVRLYQRMPGVGIGRSRIIASVRNCL